MEFASPMVADALAQYKIVAGLLNRRVYANISTDACYAWIQLNWSQQSSSYVLAWFQSTRIC